MPAELSPVPDLDPLQLNHGPFRAVPFGSVDVVETPQGHKIRPLVDGRPNGNVPGMDVCAGGLDVPAGFIAAPHQHDDTDVIVHVVDCGEEGALTLYGPDLEFEAIQHPGEVLPIQKGWPHTVVNLSLTTSIRAYEFRSNRTVLVDNPLLPAFTRLAERRGRAWQRRVNGKAAVATFLTYRSDDATGQRVIEVADALGRGWAR